MFFFHLDFGPPFYQKNKNKCDVLTNNLSESFNVINLLQRDKPIIIMFEWMRNYLMVRVATLKKKVEKYKGKIISCLNHLEH